MGRKGCRRRETEEENMGNIGDGAFQEREAVEERLKRALIRIEDLRKGERKGRERRF
jgi:hypothetical protein